MPQSYFEQQREALVGEVAESLEVVLQEINNLNRSLESVLAVGNEFSSAEALWSRFEGVMGGNRQQEGGAEGEVKATTEGDGERAGKES